MQQDVPSGILNLDKPPGISSRATVDIIVRLVGRRTKVGHAGTLDPLATGVLVVCLGKATRLIDVVQDTTKEYRARIVLGQRSASHDLDTPLEAVVVPEPPAELAVHQALAPFLGTIQQVPPAFSAVHVEGRRAYDLARAGMPVELKPRSVRIEGLELEDYVYPTLGLRIECGSGTYVRSLVRDLGERLGCGAVLAGLRRTRVGRFRVSDAVDPRALDRAKLSAALQPARLVLADWPAIRLDSQAAAAVRRGQAIAPDLIDSELDGRAVEGQWVALLDPAGELLALGQWSAALARIQPRKVFQ